MRKVERIRRTRNIVAAGGMLRVLEGLKAMNLLDRD